MQWTTDLGGFSLGRTATVTLCFMEAYGKVYTHQRHRVLNSSIQLRLSFSECPQGVSDSLSLLLSPQIISFLSFWEMNKTKGSQVFLHLAMPCHAFDVGFTIQEQATWDISST